MVQESIRVVWVALFFLSLVSCMSAQQIRNQNIAAHQEYFDSLTSEEQTKIRMGQIDIGFRKDMVRLAWGHPDRELIKKNKDGVVTIWKYTRERIHPNSELMSVPVYYRDRKGRRHVEYENVWVNRDTRERYTVAKIRFKKNKVVSIEQLKE